LQKVLLISWFFDLLSFFAAIFTKSAY